MKIKLSPQYRSESLQLEKKGDKLTVNGQEFDFTDLGEGEILPADAVSHEFFVSDVTRSDGEIILTLILPYGPNASESVKFPELLENIQDGIVELPQ